MMRPRVHSRHCIEIPHVAPIVSALICRKQVDAFFCHDYLSRLSERHIRYSLDGDTGP